jgi:hypothetical protein
VKQIRKRLTYANVMSSIAVFLILGGATAVAATKIGSHQLKSNSVTTAKIKANAVTTRKIKKEAVTTAKIKNLAVTNPKLGEGAVNFAKIASGTNLIATATGSTAATQGAGEIAADIPLTGTTTFTPTAGVVDQLNVEVRGNLTQTGTETCDVQVRPYVNGNPWRVSDGFIDVRTAGPTTPASVNEPNGQPLGGETGPVGLTTPGTPVTIGAKMFGDATNCTASSTVSVVLAVTQLK